MIGVLITKLIACMNNNLRIVYGDNKFNFEELLWKNKAAKIHHENLQVLATEIYKVKH